MATRRETDAYYPRLNSYEQLIDCKVEPFRLITADGIVLMLHRVLRHTDNSPVLILHNPEWFL